ncbi:hypothetical protein [Embleya sp. NPDC050493]|uniref:hypothetical protein n=1 Tax=Embleya sp. NPDC050493 TaxID=3363989 RepID=UPI00379F1D94
MSDQGQPKWAWWVVGIIIPIVGIVVTVWAAGGLSFGGGDGLDEVAPGASSSSPRTLPAVPGGSVPDVPPRAVSPTDAPPPKVSTGVVDLLLEPGLRYLDLDGDPPTATPSAAGADLVALFDGRPPSLAPEGSTATVARLSQSARAATPAECAAALASHGTHQAAVAAVGTRYCVRTDEGRTAYVEIVLGVPVEPHVRVKATVWK